MNLTFQAEKVECTEALGGDLLQVTFDTLCGDEDEDTRQSPYVLINRMFEFPGAAKIEWHDGADYGGGAEIISLALARDRVSIELDRDLGVDVRFSMGDREFAKLRSYLRRMLGDGVFVAA